MPEWVLLIRASALASRRANRPLESWKTLKLLFRLALVPKSHSPDYVVYCMNSVLIDAIIDSIQTARCAHLTAADFRQMRDDFEDSVDGVLRKRKSLDKELRCQDLDAVHMHAREGFCFPSYVVWSKIVHAPSPYIGSQLGDLLATRFLQLAVDPNHLLRLINNVHDDLDQCRKTTAHAKRAAWRQAISRWLPAKPVNSDFFQLGKYWQVFVRAAFEQRRSISEVYIAEFLEGHIQGKRKLFDSDGLVRTHREIARVEVALQVFRAEHGRYPTAIFELVPSYLPAIPKDAQRGLPLVYRPIGKRYLLYGVGNNGVDNGGPSGEVSLRSDDVGVPWQ